MLVASGVWGDDAAVLLHQERAMLDLLRVMSAQWWVAWRWAVVGILVGLILLWLGRHGRRVGKQPVCRKCGFDLRGKPAASTRCAECGADLTAKRAVAVGAHERWRVVMALGGLMLVLGLGVGGLRGWQFYEQGEFLPFMPMRWLAGEVVSPVPARAERANRELFRRLAVAVKDARGLIALQWTLGPEALERQLASKGVGRADMAPVIEALLRGYGAGTLSDGQSRVMFELADLGLADEAQLQRLVAAMMKFDMRLPARARRNEWVQAATEFSMRYSSSEWLGEARSGFVELNGKMAGSQRVRVSDGDLAGMGSSVVVHVPADARVGMGEIAVTFEVWVRFRSGQRVRAERRFAWPMEITADPPAVDVFSVDETRVAEMAGAFGSTVIWEEGATRRLVMRVTNLPRQVAMEVILRAGDRETVVGTFTRWAERRDMWVIRDLRTDGVLTGNQVDVVLRPSQRVAETFATPDRAFWGGEIVLRDVRVGPPDLTEHVVKDATLVGRVEKEMVAWLYVEASRKAALDIYSSSLVNPNVWADVRVLHRGRVVGETWLYLTARGGVPGRRCFLLPPDVPREGPFELELVPRPVADHEAGTRCWGLPLRIKEVKVARNGW